eukprot:CAMPEP_0172600964 /NCGR_PEP_ID=MMETSP1068-20121228/21124_1 /TAXON_ID=35684 /ORGANISM="Pseudopedinella elastica, Strain CCMP716" /LENGTH=123 /DNA_ID=CAMNT_0013401795 /DNA_START=146 /DNA_END=517 /DNA_ORIENTATION=-
MKSLFGPLGDPDYDEDEGSLMPNVTVSSLAAKDAATRNAENSTDIRGRQVLGEPSSSQPRLDKGSTSCLASSGSLDDPISQIIAEHRRALDVHISAILDDHDIRLAAAIRTELRLQELRRSTR